MRGSDWQEQSRCYSPLWTEGVPSFQFSVSTPTSCSLLPMACPLHPQLLSAWPLLTSEFESPDSAQHLHFSRWGDTIVRIETLDWSCKFSWSQLIPQWGREEQNTVSQTPLCWAGDGASFQTPVSGNPRGQVCGQNSLHLDMLLLSPSKLRVSYQGLEVYCYCY